jgi:hypothetical protein
MMVRQSKRIASKKQKRDSTGAQQHVHAEVERSSHTDDAPPTLSRQLMPRDDDDEEDQDEEGDEDGPYPNEPESYSYEDTEHHHSQMNHYNDNDGSSLFHHQHEHDVLVAQEFHQHAEEQNAQPQLDNVAHNEDDFDLMYNAQDFQPDQEEVQVHGGGNNNNMMEQDVNEGDGAVGLLLGAHLANEEEEQVFDVRAAILGAVGYHSDHGSFFYHNNFNPDGEYSRPIVAPLKALGHIGKNMPAWIGTSIIFVTNTVMLFFSFRAHHCLLLRKPMECSRRRQWKGSQGGEGQLEAAS